MIKLTKHKASGATKYIPFTFRKDNKTYKGTMQEMSTNVGGIDEPSLEILFLTDIDENNIDDKEIIRAIILHWNM